MNTTWRSLDVVIKSGELKQLNFAFVDTPNIFLIANRNEKSLYGSIEKIPTLKSYEYLIQANNFSVMARPTPSNVIYILNPSSSDLDLKIFYMSGEFNVNMLNSMQALVDAVQKTKYDGIIKDIQCPLPEGSNFLGSVRINENLTVKSIAEPLPPGDNFIGKIDVENPVIISRIEESLPPGENLIGKVAIDDSKPLNLTAASPSLMSTYSFKCFSQKILSANKNGIGVQRHVLDDFVPVKIQCCDNCKANNVTQTPSNPLTVKISVDSKYVFNCQMQTGEVLDFLIPNIFSESSVELILTSSMDYHKFFYVKLWGYSYEN